MISTKFYKTISNHLHKFPKNPAAPALAPIRSCNKLPYSFKLYHDMILNFDYNYEQNLKMPTWLTRPGSAGILLILFYTINF